MTRHKATRHGMIPLTAEEEAEADARVSKSLEDRLAELKQYRQQKEVNGFTRPDGTFVGTDEKDQLKVAGAVLGAHLRPLSIIDFKGSGGYVQLDTATMTSIGLGVLDHIQACHTREKELIEALKVDINTDITTGWPE